MPLPTAIAATFKALRRSGQADTCDITISRGSDSCEVAGAVRGNAELSIDRVTSVSVEGVDASWIMLASDYQPTGEAVLPERGDVITEADGKKWEVMPFENIGCYRETSGQLRVFVKAVA